MKIETPVLHYNSFWQGWDSDRGGYGTWDETWFCSRTLARWFYINRKKKYRGVLSTRRPVSGDFYIAFYQDMDFCTGMKTLGVVNPKTDKIHWYEVYSSLNKLLKRHLDLDDEGNSQKLYVWLEEA